MYYNGFIRYYKFEGKTVQLIDKPHFERCLLQAKNSNDQLCWLLILVGDHQWVLLVDGELVASSSGYFATLVVVEGSVDDHVD
jgi:hypothetical protein